MRGALHTQGAERLVQRIIPADAGSTHNQRSLLRFHGDHPRGCGEHLLEIHAKYVPLGSSPRMRGAHLLIVLPLIDVRIIPADAGSTLWTTFSLLQT